MITYCSLDYNRMGQSLGTWHTAITQNADNKAAYAGLRHSFLFTTKPRFRVKRTCNTKARLGGENKGVT